VLLLKDLAYHSRLQVGHENPHAAVSVTRVYCYRTLHGGCCEAIPKAVSNSGPSMTVPGCLAQEVAARRAQQRRDAEAREAQRAPKRLYLYGFLATALLAASLAGVLASVWQHESHQVQSALLCGSAGRVQDAVRPGCNLQYVTLHYIPS